MIITLSPQRSDGGLSIGRSGDVLMLNYQALDFSQLPEGATLPAESIASNWITGPVARINGVIHLTLRLPHGPNPPKHVAFPEPIIVAEDGPVILPTDEEYQP